MAVVYAGIVVQYPDSCGVRTHALPGCLLKPAPWATRLNCRFWRRKSFSDGFELILCELQAIMANPRPSGLPPKASAMDHSAKLSTFTFKLILCELQANMAVVYAGILWGSNPHPSGLAPKTSTLDHSAKLSVSAAVFIAEIYYGFELILCELQAIMAVYFAGIVVQYPDSRGVIAHTLSGWRLEPAPWTTRLNCRFWRRKSFSDGFKLILCELQTIMAVVFAGIDGIIDTPQKDPSNTTGRRLYPFDEGYYNRDDIPVIGVHFDKTLGGIVTFYRASPQSLPNPSYACGYTAKRGGRLIEITLNNGCLPSIRDSHGSYDKTLLTGMRITDAQHARHIRRIPPGSPAFAGRPGVAPGATRRQPGGPEEGPALPGICRSAQRATRCQPASLHGLVSNIKARLRSALQQGALNAYGICSLNRSFCDDLDMSSLVDELILSRSGRSGMCAVSSASGIVSTGGQSSS
ncbi:hypothetical protein FOZ60_007280 [Perkinsus olseni]|uniref:Uncharacterized protein n=1 Tax=Perkinsus olseni TaxID=32597 RepID=A0A7J6NLW6_PEROL|nr:hypothetical protein FOZ60_007280 [Perkinsus olseni]